MTDVYSELYEIIRNSLEEEFPSTDGDQSFAMDRLAATATAGAVEYFDDMLEAISHLRETVRRLSES